MKVRDRLVLTFLLVGVLLSLPSFFAAARLGKLRELAVVERAHHAEAALALGRFEAHLAELDRFLRSYVAAPDPSLRGSLFEALGNLRAEAERIRQAGYPEPAEGLDRELVSLQEDTEGIDALVQSGELLAATDAFFTLQPGIREVREGLEALARTVDERASVDFQRAEEISASARGTTLLTVLLGLALAVVITGWTTRALWSPLERLRRALSQVAEGDHSVPTDLPYDRKDEIGELSGSFRAMVQRLSELDRLKAEFVGVAGHELKTPINVIRGYTGLIEEELAGELTGPQREILDGIAEQTRAMTRMVSRLMDISRLETGSYALDLEVTSARDLLFGLERAFEVLATKRGIRFTIDVTPDVPLTVRVDIDLFRGEVLGNLVANALRFAPSGGEVRVRARGQAGGVLFEVADSGPGVHPDHQAFVFDKYYQAERSRAMGSGLGLAIAKEFAEAHGGWVRLAPDVPDGLGGAVFHVWIPTIEEDERDQPLPDHTVPTGVP
ncbi:MAG: ATP-binding protein [Longimicrobiales bacterium]